MTDPTPYIRPDVKVFLDGLAALEPRPAMAEMTLDEARMGYRALHGMGDRPPRELPVIKDITCPGPAGEIALRLYDSQVEREPGPAMVFYHGGGYVIGDLETHHSLCTELCALMDMPLVAVDYRRAPEAPFPAAIDDCEAATRWLAGSPQAMDRQITGLVPIGDSAGGNAAIVIGQQFAKQPADVPVILQVPIFPLAADALGSQSMEEFADGFILTRATVEFFDSSYKPDRSDPRAMPIMGDLAATPPTVLVTAGLDPIRDSGREYGAALSQAGVDHVHLEMRGVTHSFTNLRGAVAGAQADLERIVAAMKFMLGSAS